MQREQHRGRRRPLLVSIFTVGYPLLALVPAALAAQGPAHTLTIPRLTGTVQLDGRSDEPAWEAVAPLPVRMSFPQFDAEPSERTEIRVAHDDVYLYVAGRMFDREPAGIRATSLRRDDGSFSNDWLVLVLDTFRDRENTLVFGVTPAGVRTDVTFFSDGAANNFSWNTFWDARAVVADDGWHAEIRIPLSSLRFEVRDGTVQMGMTALRRIARRDETISWPAIDHRWGAFSIFKATQTAPVEMQDVNRRNPMYLTPYVLAGASRASALNAARTGFDQNERFSREAGLDLKYSPASNLTVDVTLNTDFAQVEADDQQVNLSRFSLFFPEKRLFFQERASIFDYGLGGSDRLFYSRRIGLEAGEPVRIFGGVRAIGRVAGWDLGLLDMQSEATGTRGSENTGVLRLRRRFLNANSYVGGMVTTRHHDALTSVAGGGDALVNVHGQNYLSLALAGTDNPADSLGGTDRLFARARLERRGIYGLLYQAELAHVGRDFVPELGFLARRDHARGAARVEYGRAMDRTSPLLRVGIGAETNAYHSYAADRVETADATLEGRAETRSGRALTLSATARREYLATTFRIAGGASVPAGEYTFGNVRLAYSPASSALLRVNANAEAGTFFDGRRVSASVTPTWNPDRRLQLSGTWQVNRLEFDARDQQLTTHIARLRTEVMLSSALSGVVFAQLNSASDAIVVNGRFRWNVREGTDLYVVCNHGLNLDRFGYEPVRPRMDNQTLLIKYSRATTF